MIFTATRRLRFGDCDPSGIAYFPAYLDMLVGVTEDLFESIGWGWGRLARELGIATPTVRLDVIFERPGFQDDDLVFACRVVRLGTSSLDLEHVVSSAAPLWRASQTIVATAVATRRSCPWPEPVRAGFARYLENDDA